MLSVVCTDAAAYSQAPSHPWYLPAMAPAQPPRAEAAPAPPRPLRLLERAGVPQRLLAPSTLPATPADWSSRLGRWVDRLLAA